MTLSKQLTYLVPTEVDSSNDSLTCSVCCNLPNRPKMMPCCKRTLCTLCAMTWLQSNTTCPFCRKEIPDSILSKGLPDSIIELRALNSMRVECPCKSQGCPWTGLRRDVFGHLKLDCQSFSGMYYACIIFSKFY